MFLLKMTKLLWVANLYKAASFQYTEGGRFMEVQLY